MNNNTTAPLSLVDNIYYGWVSVGSLVIFTNCTILLILLTNANLIVNSAFVIGLTFGDIVDGVGLVGNGVMRIINNGTTTNVHPFRCMLTFTAIFLMGNQIPGVMFALIGLERYLAVGHFDWYYSKWSPKKAWLCLLGAYAICALSLIWAFLITYSQPADVKVASSCSTPTVMGTAYTMYNYGVTVVGGVIAVATTLVAMVIFTKRKNRLMYAGRNGNGTNMLSHVKNQWRHTRSMFYLAVLDLGFVVIPNFIITLNTMFGVALPPDLRKASLLTVAGRSCFNVVIYLGSNREFRKTTLNAIGLKKWITIATRKTITIAPKHTTSPV